MLGSYDRLDQSLETRSVMITHLDCPFTVGCRRTCVVTVFYVLSAYLVRVHGGTSAMGYIGQSFAVFSLLGSGFVHFRAVHQAAGSLVGSGQQASGPSSGQDIWPGRGGG